jgi:hypothetical protein
MGYLCVSRALVHGECGYAGKLVREAIDTLVSVCGARAFAEASPIQRMWRDANVASRHGMLATGRNLEIYGRALLGGAKAWQLRLCPSEDHFVTLAHRFDNLAREHLQRGAIVHDRLDRDLANPRLLHRPDRIDDLLARSG